MFDNKTKMIAMPEEDFNSLLELIKELAPEEPINQDELGGCIWCSGPMITSKKRKYSQIYAERNISHHFPDCPWVKARILLGDKLPE